MKVIKKVLLGLGIMASISAITACSDGEDANKEVTKIDMTEDKEEFVFTEITVDSSNANTKFYLGDEFEYTGLKVIAGYTKESNDEIEVKTEEIYTFTVDTEFVDMTTVGTYLVYVDGRSGMTTHRSQYVIQVLDSEKAESNVEYLAGLDIELSTDSSYEVVNNYTISTKINSELPTPKITMRAIYFTGTTETRKRTINQILTVVDTSKVDMTKKGSYPIIYTFTEGGISVKCFVLVVVSNPVKSIEFISGSLSQSANVKGYDYSDWKFQITEESGSTHEQFYNPQYFTITGVDTLLVKEHTALVSYYDTDMAAPVTLEQKVTVTEAVGSRIVLETDLSSAVGVAEGTRVKLGETDYFHATVGTKTDSTSVSYETLTFTQRMSAGAGSLTRRNIEVYMPNAGSIVLYFGTSSAGNERTVECAYQDGEVIGTKSTSVTLDKAVFEVTEAGTYYFYSQNASLYYYGVIIAYELEGAVEPTPAEITDLSYVSGTTDYIQNGSKTGLDSLTFEAKFDDNTSKIYTLADEEISCSTFDNTVVGDQTLTITFDNGYSQKNCNLTVNVTNVTLSDVVFTSGSTTQRMSMGSYDVNDFVLTASYSDGSTKDVKFTDNDKYTLSYEVDNHTIGKKTMSITFVDKTLETKTITIDVTLIEMSSANKSFNTSSIQALTSNSEDGYTSNGFTVTTANGLTADNQVFNGFTFTQRLQLNKIDGLANYISFETTSATKLVVYARGGNTGKTMYLTQDGIGIVGNLTYSLSYPEVSCYEFNITEAGKYYLVSSVNYSSIYYLGLEYNQTESTPTTSEIYSFNLYSPTNLTSNIFEVKQNDENFDINNIIFTVTYKDGSVSHIKASETIFNETTINTAELGTTVVRFGYGTFAITLHIKVVEATN